MGTYSYTGTVRFVTVNAAGTYDITGYGARGGSYAGGAGGAGADVGGNFVLTAGEHLEIVTGGVGQSGVATADNGGGGGGGSFVLGNGTGNGSGNGTYTLLLAAGGGGGGYHTAGGAAVFAAESQGSGSGGTASDGAGGSGYKSTGASNGVYHGGSNRSGAYAGGASGGGRFGGNGGFGGGGAGQDFAGGGGGGYSGGNGGSGYNPGSGGTSIDRGTPLVAQSAAIENAANAGNGLVTITPNVTCFASGTAIRVLRDGAAAQPCARNVAVEDLAVGDVAVTASGAHRAIRWIGSRTVDCAGFDDPRRARPIRITADAFAEGVPSRPLRLSPDHALAVTSADGEELLVPAFAFLNGATVVQESVDTVTYWHVELDGGHDILLAEGLPAESYLDCGNRGFFASEDVAMDAGLDARGSCRRRANDADTLRPVRARLRERALALGWRLDEAALGGLRMIADDVTILPDTDGLAARFLLSAAARDVWLVSAASVPWDVGDTADGRRLGLCLGSLTLGDGLSVQRTIALDDPHLGDGFHPPEPDCLWTDGRARLDPELWAGCRGHVFLRLALACPCLSAWHAPKPDGADLRVA